MRKVLGWLQGGLLATSVAAGAQEAAVEDEGVGDRTEHVVVTATRREVSIDEVPIAVTEIGGEDLQAEGIRDTQSLQMAVPSLVVTVSGSESAGAVIRIRGIGTSGGNAGFESSVGVFVDGAYLSRPGIALTDLVDIERVEVLRGPQGTLLGKNTSVGAINVVTQKPVFETEAELAASYGNFEAVIARGMLNLPLIDERLAVRLSGQYNRRDGYIENRFDGEDYNDRDRYTLRGQLLFAPTDDLSLRLVFEDLSKDERCCAAPYTQYGPTAPALTALGGTVFDPPAEYTVAFDREVKSDADDQGVSGHLDWDLGWARLRGLVSYRDSRSRDAADGDYNDLDISYVPYLDSDIRTKTAELSLHGVAGRVDWVAGVYGADEDIEIRTSTLFGEDAGLYVATIAMNPALIPLYGNGTGQTDTQAFQNGESWSLFTHNIVDLGAGFDLTLGLRYLEEQKDGGGFAESNSVSCNPALPLPDNARFLCGAEEYQADYDDERVTGTLAFGKQFADGEYLYVSYSSGFKSGGINLNPPTTAGGGETRFDAEVVDAYEVGLKAPLFDGLVQTRTALFWMDIDDFQIAGFNGSTWEVATAPVRSRGVEFESFALLPAGFAVRAGVTFADARFRGNVATINNKLEGEQVTNAPRWTGQLGLGYLRKLPWSGGGLFGNVAARYQSEVNTGVNLDPAKRQGGYTLVNARLGVTLPAHIQVSLWGVNLTDEYYRMIIFDSPAQAGSYNGYPGLPRTYGVELSKRF